MATTNYENLYKLSRIMEIHNMALGIQSPSNALLSLWSILELLLEKEKTIMTVVGFLILLIW